MPETILYFAYVWCVSVILYACPLLEIYDSQPPKIYNFALEIDLPPLKFFSGYFLGVPHVWYAATEIFK